MCYLDGWFCYIEFEMTKKKSQTSKTDGWNFQQRKVKTQPPALTWPCMVMYITALKYIPALKLEQS
jgi:hypothetical protein